MNGDYDPFLWDYSDNWHFCRFCIHLHSLIGNLTCDAFPEGIPTELISKPIFHNKPMFGQKNDIIFKTKYN
jgi:hypothetical protein